jgi:hypothetical protein
VKASKDCSLLAFCFPYLWHIKTTCMKMKTLLIVCLIVSSAAVTKAQVVKKGDLLLGATMGYDHSNTKNTINVVSSNANLSPRIGLGIGRNSILGLRTSFGYSTSKNDDETYKATGGNIGVDLFWRKLLPIKNQIGWYIDASGGIAYNKQKYKTPTQDEQKSSSTNYVANAVPGLYYQPIPNLLLSVDFGGLQYRRWNSKTEYTNNTTSKDKSSSIQLSLLNSFTFGVDFILGKKA